MTRNSTFVFAVLLSASLSALGCGEAAKKSEQAPKAPTPAEAPQPPQPPIDVEVGKVDRRPMPRVATLLGNVVADQQSEVAANVAGRIILAPVERGQKVKVGETLIMVDSKAANLSASAATSQAELASAQAQQARADCGRAEGLLQQGAIGQAEYDRLRTQCKAGELQANAARAQAELQAKLAADALVRAPFTGVIGERYVNAGEYVQPNTKVASMYSLDPVRIVISVPEAAVSLVRKDVVLNVQVSAYPNKLFPATVTFVSPALRTQQRDLLVEAKAPNPEGLLRPGMFATVQASLGDEEVVTVPADAVIADGDVRRLFVVKDNRAFEMVVRVGITREERTTVYEDLSPDTAVIRHPPANLRDGAPVASGPGGHTNVTHTDTSTN
jgi:membrane fusion protein (multidrug efflux system)